MSARSERTGEARDDAAARMRGARRLAPGEPQAPQPVANVLQLQRTAGNAAVVAMLQRAALPAGPTLMRDPADAPREPANDAAVTAFMSRTYAREDHRPSTGSGLFDAEYRPTDGLLAITVAIAFDFVDGDPSDPRWVAAVGGRGKADDFAPDQFRWTAVEQEEWKANAISQVLGLWSGRYTFYIQRPGWERLPPVNVKISIVDRPAGGTDRAHFVTAVTKWPKQANSLRAKVRKPKTHGGAIEPQQSTAEFHETTSDGITNLDKKHTTAIPSYGERYMQVLRDNPRRILFGPGSDQLDLDERAALRTFGATLAAEDIPPFPITLTGHSSAEDLLAESEETLSERRARNVSSAIVEAGAKSEPRVAAEGDRGAAATPEWRRVDIGVGRFEVDQTTVAHEFGHMLGLGDEYPDEASDVGKPAAHSTLAERLIPGQAPILKHHDESIMSAGEDVRPPHYATFLEVLGEMTGSMGEWDVRPAPAGDFPTPAPGGPVPA